MKMALYRNCKELFGIFMDLLKYFCYNKIIDTKIITFFKEELKCNIKLSVEIFRQ